MKCFVSMPFGRKPMPDSSVIDFDMVYGQFIKPAVQQAGMECLRLDEEIGSNLQRSIIKNVISSDVFIADLSTMSPNVWYELGIRQALVPRITCIIAVNGTRLPFDLNSFRCFFYSVGQDNSITSDTIVAFRKYLESVTQHGSVDSAVFQQFPDLTISFPPELQPSSKIGYNNPTSSLLKQTDENTKQNILQASKTILEAPKDPVSVINIINAYRNLNEWDEMIKFIEQLPEQSQRSKEVAHQWALALNRRKSTADIEKAISIMQQLVSDGGADSSSYGIVGRLYRDLGRYDEAISSYLKGFQMDEGNYYNGANALFLLAAQTSASAKTEFDRLFAPVMNKIQEKISSGRYDVWDVLAATDLYCAPHQWREAIDYLIKYMPANIERFAIATVRNTFERYSSLIPGVELKRLNEFLQEKEGQMEAASYG